MKKIHSKSMRYSLAFLLGLVVFVATLPFWNLILAALAGWDVMALTIIFLIWHGIHKRTAKETAVAARRDDMNHSLADALVVLAGIASIGAVIFMFIEHEASLSHVLFGLVSIIVSWASVHMIYTLRYASMYYRDDEGGVDFNSKEKPKFSDFMYVALTIGMTYQVSDTSFTTADFRRVSIKHAMLSYLFGTAIIATSINFIVSLSK